MNLFVNLFVKIRPGLFAGAVVLAATAADLSAQASVSGQVRLVERPGETTSDLANTVIHLERMAASGPAGTPVVAQISMQDRQFAPRVEVVPLGSRVDFPNQDPFSHNVFSSTSIGAFDLGLYGRGRKEGWTFQRPGVHAVYCNIHPRMAAYVVAVATPWYAKAGADGRFTLPNVPPGEYTMHVWHERGAPQALAITVPAGGLAEAVNVQLDARGYKPAPHRNKFGRPYPASRDRY